jgi:uncharacterized membrane protein
VNSGLIVVQFVHIAGGAAWLGGSLFANVVILPYIARQPLERQRGLMAGIVLGPERVMIGAAVLVGLTGIARGIVFGPITSLATLGAIVIGVASPAARYKPGMDPRGRLGQGAHDVELVT